MGRRDTSETTAGPQRTCSACRSTASRDELVRWVRDDDGGVHPDLLARSYGRGAWLHARRECLAKLVPALSRGFRAPVTSSLGEALERLGQAAEHRTEQLLGSAIRQSAVVFGSDVTEKAWREGRATLLIIACDGRAALDRSFVQEAIKSGRACAWGTKDRLGALFGRPEVAVLGVIDKGLAQKLFGAIAMALLVLESAAGTAAGT